MGWDVFLHFDYKLVSYGLLQLENYAKTEEAKVEELIKAILRTQCQGRCRWSKAVGEMALHFCGVTSKKGIESLGRSHAALELLFVAAKGAVQKLLSDCRSKEDMLKQVEEGWCDSQGTLHEIRTKLQMRQGAVKNFYVNHFVAECLSNKNGAVLD
ncbi:hypothetical protein IFM89_018572 [Coptis chinensis]|uniref:Uncharacterized protein n=1 Tax=Coptis chinensis TaxID=261450 RepID=A0A835IDJ5_9MAGN|nr:hypothetical protein IFM89_018572 [Coptis chinensis]